MNDYKDVNLGDFVRRVNRDGTIDSICTRCYRTVATGAVSSATNPDLDRAEATHVCATMTHR